MSIAMQLSPQELSILFALSKEKDVFLFKEILSERNAVRIDRDFVERLPPSHLKTYLRSESHWRTEVEQNLSHISKANTRILTPVCENYPSHFLVLEKPPIFLNYEGRGLLSQSPSLAIVGSREFHSDSLMWMEKEVSKIVAHGVTTISGAARGIDQKAHRVSIVNKTPTIAFLPSGLSRVYPNTFLTWREKLLEVGGTLVSEYLPTVEMRKHHFYERNRMIAALGDALLVVEARLRSGTIMTANLASEISKTVLVVPASPHSFHHQGNLKLLFEGAQMVRSAEDVLSSLALECV